MGRKRSSGGTSEQTKNKGLGGCLSNWCKVKKGSVKAKQSKVKQSKAKLEEMFTK